MVLYNFHSVLCECWHKHVVVFITEELVTPVHVQHALADPDPLRNQAQTGPTALQPLLVAEAALPTPALHQQSESHLRGVTLVNAAGNQGVQAEVSIRALRANTYDSSRHEGLQNASGKYILVDQVAPSAPPLKQQNTVNGYMSMTELCMPAQQQGVNAQAPSTPLFSMQGPPQSEFACQGQPQIGFEGYGPPQTRFIMQGPPKPGIAYQGPPQPGSAYQGPPQPGIAYQAPPQPGCAYQGSPQPQFEYQGPPQLGFIM